MAIVSARANGCCVRLLMCVPYFCVYVLCSVPCVSARGIARCRLLAGSPPEKLSVETSNPGQSQASSNENDKDVQQQEGEAAAGHVSASP